MKAVTEKKEKKRKRKREILTLYYFIHTQTHWKNARAFSFVSPSSGNSSLPFLLSLATWMALRKSQDLSGPHSEILKPCFRSL